MDQCKLWVTRRNEQTCPFRILCHAQAFKGMRTGHRAFDNSGSSMMRRMERELNNEMKFMPDKFTDPLLDVGEAPSS